MRIGKSLLQVVVVGIAALCLSAAAHATVTFVPGNVVQVGVTGSTLDTNFFTLAPGNYDVTLSEIDITPITGPFSSITMGVLSNPYVAPPLGGPSGLGTIAFAVLAGGLNNVDIVVNATQGALPGLYQLEVNHAAPVPEPGVWLMMIGGIGLLGWLRLRKSENLG